jgi:CheY-like chemotaxis protein
VLVAHTAADALRLAQSERPDLITLDIILPDADGFTLLEWLQSAPATASIPVVMLSIVADIERGRLLGAVDFLPKPVQERTLLERVGRILSGRHQLILVADDDEDVRRLISGMLRRAGYDVIEARDGIEAVELAEAQRPGLVLMDIRMPVMDGVAALQALRERPENHDLPVVMMTASPGAFDENRSTIAALGSSTLLCKPCTAEELAEAIAGAVAWGGVA